MPSMLARFILKVFLWLPLCFAVWYYAAPLLTLPVKWLTQLVLHSGFSDLISQVEHSGRVFFITTTLRPQTATAFQNAGVVVLEVNTMLYTYGLAFLCALSLAVKEPQLSRRLALGYAALLPFQAWGVIADLLKQMAVTLGPGIASQTGFAPWQREVIIWAYQFGTLILPTLAPVMIWVVLHRNFVGQLQSSLSTRKSGM